MTTLAGQLVNIAGYTIERQIGYGGMAIVYQAIQESLRRPVALKVMNPLYAATPEFSERFLNEGRLLAALRHSHIMTIYDIGISNGLHYLSMEYVDGGDLKQRIQHGLSPDTALAYVITLGSCLKTAHAAQIVHRDVKPVNILFRHDDTLLLADFGIAKQLGNQQGLTATGSMVGSPYYLSPEQVLGKPIDGRADIYSLGIVLYEMLVGEMPFVGNSEIDVALKHMEIALPRLPQHLASFQPLLDKMTAKRPDDRFHNADRLLQAAQHLRDTGRWEEAATVATVILPRRRPEPATGMTPAPVLMQDGSRTGVARRHGLARKVGLCVVAVSLLALVGYVVVGERRAAQPQAIPGSVPSGNASGHSVPLPNTPAQADRNVQSAVPPEPIHAETAGPSAITPVQSVEAVQSVAPVQAEIELPADALLSAAYAALADNRLLFPDQDGSATQVMLLT